MQDSEVNIDWIWKEAHIFVFSGEVLNVILCS